MVQFIFPTSNMSFPPMRRCSTPLKKDVHRDSKSHEFGLCSMHTSIGIIIGFPYAVAQKWKLMSA